MELLEGNRFNRHTAGSINKLSITSPGIMTLGEKRINFTLLFLKTKAKT